MPHGFVFLCLCFSLPPSSLCLCVWHVRTVAVLPLRPRRARGGHRQAGGKGRVETVWSHAATMGSTGRNAQPGGWFRVLRATVWGTYCTMHAHAAQYLPRTVSHHSTQYSRPASIYYSTTVPRPSISAQVGWRATAMTKTKRGRQERDARYCSWYCGRYRAVVPFPQEVSVCLAHSAAAVSTGVQHTAGRAPCIRTWKVCTIHNNTHTRTLAAPTLPPTRSHLRLR